MHTHLHSLSLGAGHSLRLFFLRLLTGLVIGHPPEEVRARVLALPLSEQALLVSATLAILALASALFAQAGIGGLLAMWVTLWVLVR